MPDFGIFRGFNDKLFGDKLYAGQLPTQLGLIGSQEVRDFDLDAAAFFARVDAATGVPDSLSLTEKAAVNTLVVQMKFDGIWNSMKAIYPMVGASAAACAQNLKSSSFTGIFTAGWTFASSGVNGNGTSAYFDTNCIITSDLPSTNYGVGFYKTSTNLSAAADIGRLISNLHIYSKFSPDGKTYHRGIGAPDSYTNIRVNGFFHHYGKSASSTAFYNDIKKLTTTQGNTLNSGLSLCLAGLTTDTTSFNPSQYTFLFTSESLSDTQASNLYTAVQAMQTTLGRAIAP